MSSELFYTVLYCTILYYTVLYLLYYIVLYNTKRRQSLFRNRNKMLLLFVQRQRPLEQPQRRRSSDNKIDFCNKYTGDCGDCSHPGFVSPPGCWLLCPWDGGWREVEATGTGRDHISLGLGTPLVAALCLPTRHCRGPCVSYEKVCLGLRPW